MSLQFKEDLDAPLPSDVTLRAPIYPRLRRLGWLFDTIAALSANRRLRKIARGYRLGKAPPLPDYLREDVGLAPLPPPLDVYWDMRWK